MSGGGRDRDHGEFRLLFFDDGRHVCHGENFQAVDFFSHFIGFPVEQSDEAEALLLKPAIAEEGAGQVADADDDSIPVSIDAEALPQGGDELRGWVADAGLAEVAEIGKILANLGVGDAESFAELSAGNGVGAFCGTTLGYLKALLTTLLPQEPPLLHQHHMFIL